MRVNTVTVNFFLYHPIHLPSNSLPSKLVLQLQLSFFSLKQMQLRFSQYIQEGIMIKFFLLTFVIIPSILSCEGVSSRIPNISIYMNQQLSNWLLPLKMLHVAIEQMINCQSICRVYYFKVLSLRIACLIKLKTFRIYNLIAHVCVSNSNENGETIN